MATIYDRRTGRAVGTLSAREIAELRTLLVEEVSTDPDDYPIDPEEIDRLAESGASPTLLAILRQMLEGREDFDVSLTPK